MVGLPEKVRDAFDRLKEQNTGPHFLVVRRINGRYYVYKELRPWDERRKKWKTVSEYLGRITDDGAFIRKKGSKEDELENAKAIIEAHGGKVILPQQEEGKEPTNILTPDEIDSKILTILSMNARATLPFIAKKVGLSTSAIENRIKNLEERYGIDYTAEIDIEKLGYLKFIILVRFIGKMPTTAEMRSAAESEPRVQFAMALSGSDHNLMMYALAETNNDVSKISRALKNNTALVNYPAEWSTTPFYETYGFVPLRSEFLEALKGESVKRGIFEEEPTEKKKEIVKREFAILRELCNNGAANFTKIDKKYGFDTGRAQYSYHTLMERNLLKRATITMSGLGVRYLAVFFMKVIDPKAYLTAREHLLRNIIKEIDTPINNYILVGDIEMPAGVVLIAPIIKDGQIGRMHKELSEIGGTITQQAIVPEILIGRLCYRMFDNSHSKQMDRLVEDYGHVRPERKTYL